MGGWRLVVPRDGDQGKGGQLQRLGDRQPPLPRSACLGRRWAGGECEAPKVPGECLGKLALYNDYFLYKWSVCRSSQKNSIKHSH